MAVLIAAITELAGAFVGALVAVGMLFDASSGVGALRAALAAGTFEAAGTVAATGGLVGVCAVGAAHAASSAISSAPRMVRAMRCSASGRWNLAIIGTSRAYALSIGSCAVPCGGSADYPYVSGLVCAFNLRKQREERERGIRRG